MLIRAIGAASLNLSMLSSVVLCWPTLCTAQDAADDDPSAVEAPQVDQQRIAELTEQILAKPFETKYYRLRALEYAHGEDWKLAAADMRKFVEIKPGNSQAWQQAVTLIVLAEDVESYEKHCEKMLERFGGSELQGDLERMPKVCCLAPRPVGDMEKLQSLAEASVAAAAGNHWSAYHSRTLALVHYRRKQYAQALDTIIKSDRLNFDFAERKFDDIEVSNRAMEAMCLMRRGKLDDAKPLLAESTKILDRQFADLDALYEDEYWHDWLVAKILHDQAQQLLSSGGMGDVAWGEVAKE